MRKTYRFKYQGQILRTDGIKTYCCSLQPSYFAWERNTKFNVYNGWNGYLSETDIKRGLNLYNPDKLTL